MFFLIILKKTEHDLPAFSNIMGTKTSLNMLPAIDELCYLNL